MASTDTFRRTSVQIPEDLYARASRVADEEADRTGYRVTVSDIIRRGLEREVERLEESE